MFPPIHYSMPFSQATFMVTADALIAPAALFCNIVAVKADTTTLIHY